MMPLPSLQSALNRLDAVTVRERLMIAAAVLVVIGGLWQWLLMQPLDARRSVLIAQIDALQENATAAATAIETANANDASRQMARELAADRAKLRQVDAALYSAAVGLIRPDQMAEVVTDVLRRRGSLRLLSLRNDPARPLLGTPPPTSPTPSASDPAPAAQTQEGGEATAQAPAAAGSGLPDASAPIAGPYLQTLSIELQGSYLDVLAYLQALERLHWRLYWTGLDLRSTDYPESRVSIQISTLSLDPTWLGVGP